MNRFSNLPEDAEAPTARSLAKALDRQIRDLERISRLPSGDPELLRYFRGGPSPVPPQAIALEYAAEHERRRGGPCECELCESLREALAMRGPRKCATKPEKP